MGAGQALGLALIVSASSMVTAAWLGVLSLGLAYPLGAVLPDPDRPAPTPERVPRPRPLHGLEGVTVPPHWHVAALRPRDLTARLETPLALLLGRWGVLLVGSVPVGAFIPLALQHAAGLPAGRVSAGLALVTALGVAVYRPAGRASHHFGAGRVLRAAGVLRGGSVLALAAALHWHAPGTLALLGYAGFAATWPALSVALTARVSALAGTTRAATALGLAGAVGNGARVLGSALVGSTGYPGLFALGAGLVLLATLDITPARPRWH